jgi:predicted sulfurtransferase
VNKTLKESVASGEHLSPTEFHAQVLAAAAAAASNDRNSSSSSSSSGGTEETETMGEGEAILLDVRNVYESRIGRFESGSRAVPTIDPLTRKFSDFTAFVDAHKEELKDRTIFAYCTGGVRCEKATQYLRYATGVREVKQLSGGICAYMETFPDGGLFKGKNFVYDPRIAVPYSGEVAKMQVLGRCALCSLPFDDYSAQVRCRICRMLVLCCDSCRSPTTPTTTASSASVGADAEEGLCVRLDGMPPLPPPEIDCEHCQLAGRAAAKAKADAAAAAAAAVV